MQRLSRSSSSTPGSAEMGYARFARNNRSQSALASLPITNSFALGCVIPAAALTWMTVRVNVVRFNRWLDHWQELACTGSLAPRPSRTLIPLSSCPVLTLHESFSLILEWSETDYDNYYLCEYYSPARFEWFSNHNAPSIFRIRHLPISGSSLASCGHHLAHHWGYSNSTH